MTRLEIASAIEQIVTAALSEHDRHGDIDVIARDATLHDGLGMDEADIIEVMLCAEDRFGVTLPDDAIGFSSTLADIVNLVALRLSERELRRNRSRRFSWQARRSPQRPEAAPYSENSRHDVPDRHRPPPPRKWEMRAAWK